MDPKPQPASENWITPEAFARNFHRELEGCPLKMKSLKALTPRFVEEDLIPLLLHIASACRAFPRTTQAARLRRYELTPRSFKTMLRHAHRLAEFMERVNEDYGGWRGFGRAPEDVQQAIKRAERWVRNPSQTLPKDRLCGLVDLVRDKTGKPNYRHLENLLDAAFAAAKVKNPPFVGAENIRKACKQKTISQPRAGAS
jgi:hypothetical protein